MGRVTPLRGAHIGKTGRDLTDPKYRVNYNYKHTYIQSCTSHTAPAPFVDPETKVQALEARLEFLRDSCRIMVARKTDMLEEKDSLLARQSADLATLKAQLAAIHQTKNELLAELVEGSEPLETTSAGACKWGTIGRPASASL